MSDPTISFVFYLAGMFTGAIGIGIISLLCERSVANERRKVMNSLEENLDASDDQWNRFVNYVNSLDRGSSGCRSVGHANRSYER